MVEMSVLEQPQFLTVNQLYEDTTNNRMGLMQTRSLRIKPVINVYLDDTMKLLEVYNVHEMYRPAESHHH